MSAASCASVLCRAIPATSSSSSSIKRPGHLSSSNNNSVPRFAARDAVFNSAAPSASGRSGSSALATSGSRRRTRARALAGGVMANVGDPQWLVQQGVAAGVILGGAWATGALDQVLA
eukprot:CAMPEP_0197591944 /NCGR_PEP_ID=MMETSP1326-20131121/14143_1 /TAXON_ID=1155430 /ORGANISM="Genus nov. species nov., Strain RCC2288" /LENGTH=117 /DNA_ID=CAMNT_0043157535 /DNA_START=115 /DNA_END=465 /DNA_ORIENTATION=-